MGGFLFGIVFTLGLLVFGLVVLVDSLDLHNEVRALIAAGIQKVIG